MKRFSKGSLDRAHGGLRTDPLFNLTLSRLRYNFTLYAFLPVDKGRHRLLTMSFVEPIDWSYQRAELKKDGTAWEYHPFQPAPWDRDRVASLLGWRPTRIRFQTPSAENAASYHFEVVAPKGVRIAEATLIAGRPHDPERRLTVDHIRADSLTVGLHAVDVPPNSLCRAQVQLRVQRAGWLTTLAVSAAAIVLVLLTVALHAWLQEAPDPGQDTNVIVLLISAAAAAATFIAQRDFPGVAARLAAGMRGVGVAVVALPIIAAGLLSYKDVDPAVVPLRQLPQGADTRTKVWLTVLTVLALLAFITVALTWWWTWQDERRQEMTSPWDMTRHTDGRKASGAERATVAPTRLPKNFHRALRRFGFTEAAVGVRSSEGWHWRYCWTDDDQDAALKALGTVSAGSNFGCAAPGRCLHAYRNGCRSGVLPQS
jgi:hypothetical protein